MTPSEFPCAPFERHPAIARSSALKKKPAAHAGIPGNEVRRHRLLLHSKAHQLAEYLRDSIRQGRLAAPLPGMRLWSRQLGVSRRTLQDALTELRQEGWLTVRPRGIHLNPTSAKPAASRTTAPCRVRWLLESTYRRYLYNYHVIHGLLQERLGPRGIELSWETCPPARLCKIARQPAMANELLLLASLPPACQRLFAASGKPALILGEAAPGVALPFINADLAGIVRHATFRLLRQGCTHLEIVHVQSTAAGIRSAEAAFQTACADWTRSPVTHRIIATALDQMSLQSTMRQLVSGVKGRTGILVLAPVPVGMVVTALLQHGIAVPAQATVAALMHPKEAIQLYPPPVHYPWPMAALVRQICSAAERFFATGTLPADGKTIAIEAAGAES